MKIVQGVTYVSKDGAYGGPVAVAAAQCASLARRGHEVHLVAGWDGEVEFEVPGVSVHLTRVKSLLGPLPFVSKWSPSLMGAARAVMEGADVSHVHFGRDLVSATVSREALRQEVPLVVQTHGMVKQDGRITPRLFDGAFTGRPLARADTALALTESERVALTDQKVAGGRVLVVDNGLEVSGRPRLLRQGGTKQVLFLARLHPRKRPATFVEMAAILLNRGLDLRFSIVGPDEGALSDTIAAINASGWATRISVESAIEPGTSVQRLADADVFVLPSFAEVVPMTILEAASAGTPIVMTSDNGLAEPFASARAALTCSGTAEQLAACVESIVGDPALAETLSSNAHELLRLRFGIDAVAVTLEAAYASAVTRHARN